MKKRSNVLRFFLTFIMASLMTLAGCGSGTSGQKSSETAERSIQSAESEEKVEKTAYDEDGLTYFANQILLYAYPGTDPELIEQLAEEIDADVVDVIPELQFYQLEFRQDKTYSELMESVDFFLVRQFIMDADLNYYSAETQPN